MVFRMRKKNKYGLGHGNQRLKDRHKFKIILIVTAVNSYTCFFPLTVLNKQRILQFKDSLFYLPKTIKLYLSVRPCYNGPTVAMFEYFDITY